MRTVYKALLPLTILIGGITPSSAAFWICCAPEIDAHSGTAAVAAVVAFAFMIHHRARA